MADTFADIWTDRRVKIGYETAEELAKRYNEANWRGHPESQADALDESLDTLQWIGSVKVNIQSGKIFDGHLRVERALLKNPVMPIPVDYYDLSPDEEALALQIHDAITEQAQPIADKLAALMERTKHLTADKPGLAAMLEQLKVRAGVNGNGSGDNNYVREIKSPEYVVTGNKPEVSALYDDSRTRQLMSDIDRASIPDEEKAFLRVAAQRHTVLSFKNIAEYYAHSNEEMQTLMEDSTLVIIDFNKAISLGFVQLTKEIAELVREEYGDDD